MRWANRPYRWIGLGCIVLAVGLSVSFILEPRMNWWGASLWALILATLGAVGWECFAATHVSLVSDAIVVRNPFHVITIPLREIQRVSCGSRLSINLQNETVVRVWSVQAANISLILHRRSYVDRVALELYEALKVNIEPSQSSVFSERIPSLIPSISAVVLFSALSGLLNQLLQSWR